MAGLTEIVSYLDGELRTAEIKDYPAALNGLQLANRGTVNRVAASVDFSLRVVTAAVERKADLLILHHGMFWSGAAPLVGARYEQLSLLLAHGIAVYSSHLPLDLHASLGNNVLLARELGLEPSGGFAASQGVTIGVSGDANVETQSLADVLSKLCVRHGGHLVTTPVARGQRTKRWGICSGAGASPETMREAVALGIDTMIVGEGPHHTAVQAGDMGLTILYAGHYATETLGVAAVASEIGRRFGISSSFIDAPTGL